MGGGPAKDFILLTLPFPEPKPQLASLRSKFPKAEFHYHQINHPNDPAGPSEEIPAKIWREVTVLYTLFTFPTKVQDAPNLDLIQLVSAGSNQIQKNPIYTDSDVLISTSSGIHGPQIAEWCIMSALVRSHRYNILHDLQKEHKWGKFGGEQHDVRDWVGRRLGVLGYGSIGRQVARVAKAMGAGVIAYTATSKDTPEKKKDTGFIVPGTGDPDGEIPSEWYSGLEREKLHHFLKQDIDWLVVSVPLTDQTRHFISTEELDVLTHNGKRPVHLQNIARGPIIDQPALVKALKDGTLESAALDVTDPEPLPEDSELWDMPNVIVTPHVSGAGVSYTERSFQLFEQNLQRREKGEKLLNIVRRDRGY